MFKKLLISAIVVTAVFAAGASVYAQSETAYTRYKMNDTPVFELLSDKEESKTFESEYVISATAKEDTEVSMSLFWFKTEDEKSILTKNKSYESSGKKGSWILQQSEEFTVGSSGIFAEPVTLSLGKNRIVLFIKDKNGNTAEKALEVERFWEKQASEEVNGSILNKFVEDISNSVNVNK
jgi:lipopolysaccharide export LptBFGC system permease protein LptF